MAELPDASHQGREKRKNAQAEKNVQKVTTGEVKTKKKSGLKKFTGVFVPEDTVSVKNYIWTDVIVPGIKNALADVGSILLFGETGRIGGRAKNHTPYSNLYRGDPRDRERRDYTRPRTGYDFDDILFETRADAELVLDQLEEIINVYGMASVADLYDSAGVAPPSYTASSYGWTDLQNVKPIRIQGGYALPLPEAMPIT